MWAQPALKKGLFWISILWIACGLLNHPLAAWGDTTPGDTEIYGVSTASVNPNVLIIFDNSGSMNELIQSALGYDPNTQYPIQNACGGQGNLPCDPDMVYRWRGVEKVWQPFIARDQVNCWIANLYFTYYGIYTGWLSPNGTCWAPYAIFATGNYINFLASQTGTSDPTVTKLEVAKSVITNLIASTTGVNFGVMVFNLSQGGHLLEYGGNVGIADMDGDTDGDGISNRDELIQAIQNIQANTWTPLAETLYEAGLYFQGKQSAFNGNLSYTSPIQFSCQKTYVILMTDGMSTMDRDPVLQTLCNNGDCDGDGQEPGNYSYQGSDYLDDVARYLYETDLLPQLSDIQNVVTYTIGFGLPGSGDDATQLLQATATNGHGKYYSAYNTQGLAQAFTEILGAIIQANTSFTAPVVPLNPENRTFSGDRLYMGFFKPKAGPFWSGNLKRFRVDTATDQILDRNNQPALDEQGQFLDTAVSYWSSGPDGGQVEAGGVGEVLLQRTSPRHLYTYLGTQADLTAPENAFTVNNPSLLPETFQVADPTARDRLIQFIHGYDAYGADPSQKRDWILGDILHSRPLVIHYSSSRSVIYVGANDGMLHAFDDADGTELWGFIPPELLAYLKELAEGTVHPYYVDGSPRAWILDANGDGVIQATDGDQVILVFGFRRGGRAIAMATCGDTVPVHRGSYYALDVTDPDHPRFLWRTGPPLTDLDGDPDVDVDTAFFDCEMGESWSEPAIGPMKIQGQVRQVVWVGGGYDETSEDLLPPAPDTKGRAVFALDLFTGQKIWEYSWSTSVLLDTGNQNPDLTHAIASTVTALDTDGNGYLDRIYVGDLGGNLWRFDVGAEDPTSWEGWILFQSNPGADGSTGRKIFFPPDYTQEVGYDLLFFGTGDREHPRDTSVVDRLYALKDDGSGTLLTEADLVDVTENLLQAPDTDAATQNQILADLAQQEGWYIRLDQVAGEKVVSESTLYAGVVYFPTYAPLLSDSQSPCQADRGTSRVYAVAYLTGEAVFNYDPSNDTLYDTLTNPRARGGEGEVLLRSDRVLDMGSGLPSGITLVMNETGEALLLTKEGGLVQPGTPPRTSLFWILQWRETF